MSRTITHKVTGETVTFIETAAETNGKHLLIEVNLPPNGDGPPLHIHDEFEEEFECISGYLTVTLGKEKRVLSVGEKALVKPLISHTFTNNHNEPLIFRVKLTPPSQFEESIRIHYGLMEDGLTDKKGNPKSLLHTALIMTLQNTWIAGLPVGFQRWLFGFLVKRGYKKNAFAALKKYAPNL